MLLTHTWVPGWLLQQSVPGQNRRTAAKGAAQSVPLKEIKELGPGGQGELLQQKIHIPLPSFRI